MKQARERLLFIAGDDEDLRRKLDAWLKYFVVEMGCAERVSAMMLNSEIGRETVRKHVKMRAGAQLAHAIHDSEFVRRESEVNPISGAEEYRVRAWLVRP